MKLKKGEVFNFEIEKYAFEGKGIAKVNKEELLGLQKENDDNNYVVFVNGSYPGDKVEARITKIKKNYAEAAVVKILSPSEYRVTAKCKYFGTCGGCKQQDMDYDVQIKYKQEQVKEIFTKLGGFDDFILEEIIPADKIFFYRNKMEFSFAERRWLTEEEIRSEKNIEDELSLGLHAPRTYDKVLNIDKCFLQSELSNLVLNFTRVFFKERETAAYSTKNHQGYLRHLVIKQSHHTSDFMVNLVTSSEDDKMMKEYSSGLIRQFPQITTIINNINLKKAAVAIGDYEIVYHGSGFIYEYIGKYKYRISANSFFQTNSLQAEKLYDTALEYAALKGDEIVYDLYSGAGTISIFVSGNAKEVYAFESVEPAVRDAEENAKLNNIANVHFIQADLYKTFLPEVESNNIPKPDVIIIDPPRGGMHKNTVDDVLQLNPEKIVYVSCNPATQARDIKLLTEEKYKLIKTRPVDMFPHTYHIENVALLVRE